MNLQWRIAWDRGEAFVTPLGAMVGPVSFTLDDGDVVQPFAIAPWSDDTSAEHAALPPLLQALRGEWVGVPFGMPSSPPDLPEDWRPLAGTRQDFGADFHGYSSNATWQCVSDHGDGIALELDYPAAHAIRRVRRTISGVAGRPRLAFELGINARDRTELPLGIHPVFRLPERPGGAELRFSGEPVVRTYPIAAEPGISRIAAGLTDLRLDAAPVTGGGTVDLAHLPLDFATEELVLVTGHAGEVTLTNHREGYAIRMGWDAEAFPSCMLWISNRGRTAYPWNARFLAIGIEPVVAPFDLGVEVARNPANPLRRAGTATSRTFAAGETWTTQYWIEVERASRR